MHILCAKQKIKISNFTQKNIILQYSTFRWVGGQKFYCTVQYFYFFGKWRTSLRCTSVKVEYRQRAEDCLDFNHRVDYITLINASRNEDFINTSIQIVKDITLNSDIDLNEHYI